MEAKALDGEDEEAHNIVDNAFVPSLIRFKVDAKLSGNIAPFCSPIERWLRKLKGEFNAKEL